MIDSPCGGHLPHTSLDASAQLHLTNNDPHIPKLLFGIILK
jgi:hypothetical protein